MQSGSSGILARLSLGGLLVVLTLVAWLYQLPSSFFPFDGAPLWVDAAGLAALYLLVQALAAPWELSLGLRNTPLDWAAYLRGWAGRSAVEGLLMTGAALALLLAGRLGGLAAAVTLAAAGQAALLWRQPRRAALLAAAWNTAGLALSAALPWAGVTTVRHLVETLLGCTLWSLAGLLVLRAWPPAARLVLDGGRILFNPLARVRDLDLPQAEER